MQSELQTLMNVSQVLRNANVWEHLLVKDDTALKIDFMGPII